MFTIRKLIHNPTANAAKGIAYCIAAEVPACDSLSFQAPTATANAIAANVS